MADVINLRQMRKRAARKKKDDEARASRDAHGQAKAVRSRTAAEREKSARLLEAHRITTEEK